MLEYRKTRVIYRVNIFELEYRRKGKRRIIKYEFCGETNACSLSSDHDIINKSFVRQI